MVETFAQPPAGIEFGDCYFYHVMDIPGHGTTDGQWDLRGRVDEYLGAYDFKSKSVLEIGPASGFLTFEMEKRGADVTCLEVTDQHGWDFVPFGPDILGPVFAPREQALRKMKNSFWFAYRAFESKAKMYYANVYEMPTFGKFNVGLLASILLHTQNPLRIVQQCSDHCTDLIITDLYYPDLQGAPVMRLHPSADNKSWDTWWHLSPDLFIQFLRILGFNEFSSTVHRHSYMGRTPLDFFTLVASRTQPRST